MTDVWSDRMPWKLELAVFGDRPSMFGHCVISFLVGNVASFLSEPCHRPCSVRDLERSCLTAAFARRKLTTCDRCPEGLPPEAEGDANWLDGT